MSISNVVSTPSLRTTRRGAKYLWRGRQGPHSWVTVADPEGNEFCIS